MPQLTGADRPRVGGDSQRVRTDGVVTDSDVLATAVGVPGGKLGQSTIQPPSGGDWTVGTSVVGGLDTIT